MVRIGFHASHEQFAPSDLLRLVQMAEAAGFDCAMSSDHFKPWGPAQGHSGFAWSWLGSALQATSVPFGVISALGYRYHPAIIAQAAATLCEMYPGRLWWALGSGQRLNEDITGLPWPEKAERNARLEECAEIETEINRHGWFRPSGEPSPWQQGGAISLCQIETQQCRSQLPAEPVQDDPSPPCWEDSPDAGTHDASRSG